MIKKWAYTTGEKGEPIKDPDGTGREAVVMPEGEEITEEVPEEPTEGGASSTLEPSTEVGALTPVGDPTTEAPTEPSKEIPGINII